jgi:hypothetical protein
MHLHVAALVYSNRFLTDGIIPVQMVPRLVNWNGVYAADVRGKPRLVDPEKLANELVANGLWKQSGNDYFLADFPDYQISKSELEELSKVRSEAGKRGAAASHGGHRSPPAAAHPDERGPPPSTTKDRLPDIAAGSSQAKHLGASVATANAKDKPVPVSVPVPDRETLSVLVRTNQDHEEDDGIRDTSSSDVFRWLADRGVSEDPAKVRSLCRKYSGQVVLAALAKCPDDVRRPVEYIQSRGKHDSATILARAYEDHNLAEHRRRRAEESAAADALYQEQANSVGPSGLNDLLRQMKVRGEPSA